MEQIDKLLNGRSIIQDTKCFQFGIDAVLLAHFAAEQTRKGDNVIDLGTGTGIIPLLMETSCLAQSYTGLEVQEESADMAQRSVQLNDLESKIQIVQGDLKEVSQLFQKHSFNVVTSNPPYMSCDTGKENPNDAKAIARHEVLCTLEDVVAAADYLLLPRGKFFMIHRPSRLSEIFSALGRHNLEPKRMQLVQPFADKEANLVMIEARKNAKVELRIEPSLIVRNSDGSYTEEINQIYGS